MITGIKTLTDTEFYYYNEFDENLINQILSVIEKEKE
jgi:hypothetical protein